MMFIDGNWLYKCIPGLGRAVGKPWLKIDYEQLPLVLIDELTKQARSELHLVRKHIFLSFPTNYDEIDEPDVKTDAFVYSLKERYYDVTELPIDYRGRRLKARDRDPDDDFDPREKGNDVGLASAILYYAAINSYDIALAVIGDLDFKPALQYARLLGKRVAIASIRANCSQEYAVTGTREGIKDFETMWLDELVGRIEYEDAKPEAGPGWRMRSAPPQRGIVKMPPIPIETSEVLVGRVKNIVAGEGYAFLTVEGRGDYYFRGRDLEEGVRFHEIAVGDLFLFEVLRPPTAAKAGAGRNLRRQRAEEAPASAPPAEPAPPPPPALGTGDSV
jgi:hypothetical protein